MDKISQNQTLWYEVAKRLARFWWTLPSWIISCHFCSVAAFIIHLHLMLVTPHVFYPLYHVWIKYIIFSEHQSNHVVFIVARGKDSPVSLSFYRVGQIPGDPVELNLLLTTSGIEYLNPKRCRGGVIHLLLRRSAAISQGMIQMFSNFLTFSKMMLGPK